MYLLRILELIMVVLFFVPLSLFSNADYLVRLSEWNMLLGIKELDGSLFDAHPALAVFLIVPVVLLLLSLLIRKKVPSWYTIMTAVWAAADTLFLVIIRRRITAFCNDEGWDLQQNGSAMILFLIHLAADLALLILGVILAVQTAGRTQSASARNRRSQDSRTGQGSGQRSDHYRQERQRDSRQDRRGYRGPEPEPGTRYAEPEPEARYAEPEPDYDAESEFRPQFDEYETESEFGPQAGEYGGSYNVRPGQYNSPQEPERNPAMSSPYYGRSPSSSKLKGDLASGTGTDAGTASQNRNSSTDRYFHIPE